MALARFKALCIDAIDPERMAQFWAPALGLPETEAVPSGFKICGSTPEQTVWVNRVTEEKTVKHRVHFDLHGAGVDDYPGATPISAEGQFPWRVMQDPEGGEFCLFVRDPVPDQLLYEVVVDSVDPAAQAAWWHDVLGGRLQHNDTPGEDWSWLEEVPGMPFECLVFSSVPEVKLAKNRIHWDVDVPDQGTVEQLIALGAGLLRPPDDEIGWHILLDPEGNEFCAFLP